MFKRFGLIASALAIFCTGSYAALDTVGAVLHLQKVTTHVAHINVPVTATTSYFGYLAGPAIDNQYCDYRAYVDSSNRNMADCIVKFEYIPILEYFDDTSVNEHNAGYAWGRDEYNGGPAGTGCLGLGAFRLVDSLGNWLNPQLGHNLDSLVITILDSSEATPKFSIAYWGWPVGTGGTKLNVTWTWSAIRAMRPAYCTVAIQGSFNGKVVAGFTNHGPTSMGGTGDSMLTVVEDSTEALLADIGKQCGPGEDFVDTMALAIYAKPSYYAGYTKVGYNLGMLLKPDSNRTVQYQVAYNAATEPTALWRTTNWHYTMFGLTPPTGVIPQNRSVRQNAIHAAANKGPAEYFSLSGRRLTTAEAAAVNCGRAGNGVYIVRQPDGSITRQEGFLKQ